MANKELNPIDVYVCMRGYKAKVKEAGITCSDVHWGNEASFGKITLTGIVSVGELKKLMGYRDGAPSGTVINDEIRPDTVSFEDWVKSIAKGKDVYLPSDILLKALKEYFDKILTTNDKE